jgi:hypothetical protein
VKTYLSVGIGDMMCLDSVLTQGERQNITEIYWACRFGKDLIPLFENNSYYPNLLRQHIIPDDLGIEKMNSLDSSAKNFWHFRPDFERNFEVGLSLFELKKNEVNAINAAAIFLDPNRHFTNSSFLDDSKTEDVNWIEIGVEPNNYILFHYPTSTRPRSDIASISNQDWDFINSLSNEKNLKVVVITDSDFDYKLDNSITLHRPKIKTIVGLCKNAKIYAGCDSFVSILVSKVLEPENLYVKSHNPNIQSEVLTNTWLQRFFLPHSPQEISTFYRNYIGK